MSNKRKKMIAIISMLIVLTAVVAVIWIMSDDEEVGSVAKKPVTEMEITDPLYNIGSDFPVSLSYYGVTESEDNYYIAYGLEWPHIYELNKKTGIINILCRNPQCDHENIECSANIEGPGDVFSKIIYHNDKIYYFETYNNYETYVTEEWLVSMDLNGGE